MFVAVRKFGLLVSCWLSSAALATTLVQLSFDEVVASSELVFEGRVVSVEARETGPRSIHTFVSFEIMEVIKGDLIASTLELRYLGGRVGNRQMEVIDINVPVLGETGIYFVESMREMQIHPLVGWSQGHFLTRQDDSGIRRIHSAGDRPIQTVTSESAVVTRARRYAPAAPLILDHDGVARGVEIQAVTDNSIPMSASAFKVLVRDVSQRQTAAGIGR
jgi:hypothetical protein